MKLLWATTHYGDDPAGGGSGISVQLAREALMATGHHVDIVKPVLPAGPVSERAFLSPARIVRMAKAVAVAGRDADLLHAMDRRQILATHLAARRLRKPWVLTLRDIGLLCPSGLETMLPSEAMGPPIAVACSPARVWRTCAPQFHAAYAPAQPLAPIRRRLTVRAMALALDRRVARRATCVIFVSEALRQLHATAGFPGARPTAVVYSPVSAAPPVAWLRHVTPVVLYVGKPSLGKGWPLFVRAAEQHRGRALFVQIGPHPANPPKAVSCWGPESHAVTLRVMRGAHLVVVPSLQHDAFPRVALESQAQETPVVSSDRGGLPEVVLGGWSVRPNNVPDWVQRVLKLCPETLARIGHDARERVLERFGPGPTTKALVDVYERVA